MHGYGVRPMPKRLPPSAHLGGEGRWVEAGRYERVPAGRRVDRAAKEFGKLTILVNNAGGGGPKPFDMPMGDFDWAYELNVFSPVQFLPTGAPHMNAAGGGAILNISSMAGENKNPRCAPMGRPRQR